MNPHRPREAEIVARDDESPSTFSWHLRLLDDAPFDFSPGQFNMLYLFGAGEVPISIVSQDPAQQTFMHTLRAAGRVTSAMQRLCAGDLIGLRGPYGRGWPMDAAIGRDLVIVTGGLGCAPAVSIVHRVLAERERYGRVSILQGVKHADDLIWREQYAAWAQQRDVEVLLAADVATPGWPGHVGLVTALFDRLDDLDRDAVAMLCGPEVMMRAAATELHARGLDAEHIHLSMERNMQCAIGHCGHCQFGAHFVCQDGPVFAWPEVRALLDVRGL